MLTHNLHNLRYLVSSVHDRTLQIDRARDVWTASISPQIGHVMLLELVIGCMI